METLNCLRDGLKLEKVEAALLDVRKAYRVLSEYQVRVIGLLRVIGEKFGGKSYERVYHPKQYKSRGHGLLKEFPSFSELESSDDAARWLLLPLLNATMFWLKPTEEREDYDRRHERGDVMIDIQILSDTGLNDDHEDAGYGPEGSASQIAITLLHCDQPMSDELNKGWFSSVWQWTDAYPEPGRVAESGVDGYRWYREFIPLTALVDRPAVHKEMDGLWQRAMEQFGTLEPWKPVASV